MTPAAAAEKRRKFDPQTFLSTIDGGRTISSFAKKQTIFAQGDLSDAVFYIQEGRLRLIVVATSGKEATIGILNEGDFLSRRLPCEATPPRALGNSNGRLLDDANRQEVHDRSTSPGTRVFRDVRGIFC